MHGTVSLMYFHETNVPSHSLDLSRFTGVTQKHRMINFLVKIENVWNATLQIFL